jgi:hypothetical protein
MRAMLTDVAIRRAKPRAKPYRLADANGLFLYIPPKPGGWSWRLRYYLAGREQTQTLGHYPVMTLLEARNSQHKNREARRAGISLISAKAKASRSFEDVAREWHRINSPRWAAKFRPRVLQSFEAGVFPAFGHMPIDGIKPPAVLELIRDMEARGSGEHARKIRQRVSSVFVYAIATGLATDDPAAVIQGAMAPITRGRRAAILELDELRRVLPATDSTNAGPVPRLAMRLLALTALRPGELRGATWDEFEGLDGPAPVWRIPAARMKMSVEHVVPLARQAVDLVSHGWRASFSTIMNERFPADRAVIDLMLAHLPARASSSESAYNRAQHTPRRRELAQLWADLRVG